MLLSNKHKALDSRFYSQHRGGGRGKEGERDKKEVRDRK